jgi:hypothetical protein
MPSSRGLDVHHIAIDSLQTDSGVIEPQLTLRFFCRQTIVCDTAAVLSVTLFVLLRVQVKHDTRHSTWSGYRCL